MLPLRVGSLVLFDFFILVEQKKIRHERCRVLVVKRGLGKASEEWDDIKEESLEWREGRRCFFLTTFTGAICRGEESKDGTINIGRIRRVGAVNNTYDEAAESDEKGHVGPAGKFRYLCRLLPTDGALVVPATVGVGKGRSNIAKDVMARQPKSGSNLVEDSKLGISRGSGQRCCLLQPHGYQRRCEFSDSTRSLNWLFALSHWPSMRVY